MSYKDYIIAKMKKPEISIDISEYKDFIQNEIFSIKDRKDLYGLFLNIEQLSRGLNYIGYPRINELLFHVNIQDSKYNNEYSNFLEWCKNNQNETTKLIQNRISNLRSLYFLNTDISVEDIKTVVDYKCDLVYENSKMLLDILECSDDFIESSYIKIKPKSENKFELHLENEFCEVVCRNNMYFFNSVNESLNNDQNCIYKILNNYKNKYKELYFVAKNSERKTIQESIQKMYLGKDYIPFKYELEVSKPNISEEFDLWKMKIKNEYLKFEFGKYRILDDSSPIRYIKLEQK